MRPLLLPLFALTLGLSACTQSEPKADAAGALHQLPGAVKEWNSPTSPKVAPPVVDLKAEVKPPPKKKLPGATQEWNSPTSPKAAGLDGL